MNCFINRNVLIVLFSRYGCQRINIIIITVHIISDNQFSIIIMHEVINYQYLFMYLIYNDGPNKINCVLGALLRQP